MNIYSMLKIEKRQENNYTDIFGKHVFVATF